MAGSSSHLLLLFLRPSTVQFLDMIAVGVAVSVCEIRVGLSLVGLPVNGTKLYCNGGPGPLYDLYPIIRCLGVRSARLIWNLPG